MSIYNTYKRIKIAIAICIVPMAIVLTMVILVTNSFAMAPVPSLDWAFNASGSDNDFGADMAMDSLGNILITGSFSGTADFDPGPGTMNLTSAGLLDIYVASYSPDGSLNWAFRVGDSDSYERGLEIATDSAGNVLITGRIDGGMADFDPGPGVTYLTPVNHRSDIFVASYSANGGLNWAFSLGDTGFDIGWGIATDGADNVLVTGNFRNTVDFDPGPGTTILNSPGKDEIFVASYSTSGSLNWAFIIDGSTNNRGSAVTTDAAGNVVVTGHFRGTADFDPGPGVVNLTAAGISDIFVASYSSSGSLNWAFNLGGGSSAVFEEGGGIATDHMGNVLVTGNFGEVADFDPGPGTTNLTAAGRDDIFVASYSPAGHLNWALNVGSSSSDVFEGGTRITADSMNNVLVTGVFQDTADFDPGAEITNLTSAGGFEIFVASYSPAGNFNWAFKIGSSGDDVGLGIVTDSADNVFVSGWFQGTADFDPGPGTTNLTSAGGSDIFVARYAKGTISIEIDIKPGSDTNPINCNNDNLVIPVAILTTDAFDATTVDHATVTFAGASETHMDPHSGEPIRHEEDVDSDGDIDLIFHFRLDESTLTCSSEEGRLAGLTYSGQAVEGTDSLLIFLGGS